MAATASASSLNRTNNLFLARAYGSTNPAESRIVYDDWAATYDNDMITEEYVAPPLAAEAALKALGVGRFGENLRILDAGCGTGLVGVSLAEKGAKNIDGVDYSQGMLAVARKLGIYGLLEPADLTKPVRFENGTYDAVVSCGTLTQGHVGPEAIEEMARIVKPGGVVVSTVLDNIWESRGYKAEVDRLVSVNKVELVSAELAGYRKGSGVSARMLVLRVK